MLPSRNLAPGLIVLSGIWGLPSLARADDNAKVAPVAKPAAPKAALPSWLYAAAATRSIYATSIDDVASAGGLRLSSTGEGGGGKVGPSTMSPIRTLGGGHGVEDLDAFDHRRTRLTAEHIAAAPPPSGDHLAADLIQRVVRDNFGRFQVCYDDALPAHPGLAGRVAVKFIINARGAVALASDAGSDLADPDVVSCVVRAFDVLTFPESHDSAITVIYPLVFGPPPSP
jgi:hypothetical protein